MMAARDVVAKWASMPALAFDTETTGVNVHDDRVVTACVVEFQPEKRPAATSWLLNPGVDIPAEATAVHGVTTDHARQHGQDPAVALFEITARLALWLRKGLPIVGFNVAFDLTIVEAENTRHGLPTLVERLDGKVEPVIDALVLDRHVEKYRKKACGCGCGATDKTLTGCCQHYRVPLVAAHTAESDAASAVRLFRAIVAAHPQEFRGMLLPGLHEAQKGWRREQQDSLRAYFDKAGTPHDGCDGSWPIVRTPAAVADAR